MKPTHHHLLLLTCLLPLCAIGQEQPTGVQVSGQATEDVANDRAGFLITLQSKGESPKAARETLLAQAKALNNLLTQFPGVEKTQTQAINSAPIWFHQNNSQPRITGYTATSTTSTECPAENAGDLAAQLLELNPHQLNGPNFHLSASLRKSKEIELLQKATKDAKEKAEALAEAVNMKVGNALFLANQTSWGGPQPIMARAMAMDSFAGGASAEPMPTQSGEGTLSASVEGRFELIP
jgi:uncharacterized protein